MADYTDNLLLIMQAATDFSILVEFFPSDAVPSADGFDPALAVRRFAASGGVSFRGLQYTRLVNKFGSIKRTITAESNSASVDFSNLSREISTFEFSSGFEGLIKVVRLISRSQSIELSDSIVLFVGRCEQPTSGTKESLSVVAKQIAASVDVEIPRRKFGLEDHEGRTPQDPLYEGFRFMPQYGVTTYSQREKRGGLLGLLGFKKTVTRNLQYSSFSDLDAEKSVTEIFGRAQVAGTLIAYADTGQIIQIVVAWCEGLVANVPRPRSTDPRLQVHPDHEWRLGAAGGAGNQFPITSNPNWVGNGYYSRTAFSFCQVVGSLNSEVDPAPELVNLILGRVVDLPNAAGSWVLSNWSDNPAAQARFLLTSDNYYKLDKAWIDDAAALESYRFNDEIIFDTSYSDVLFTPQTAVGYGGDDSPTQGRGGAAHAIYYRPTSSVTPEYFLSLNNNSSAADTYLKPPVSSGYELRAPIEPPIEPGGGGGGGGSTATLDFYLRRRYTSNVVVTEQTKLTDFLHQTIFPAARMFLSQSPQGKIQIRNKKPNDFALAATASAGANISVDDASHWVASKEGFAVIDPNTNLSEIRTVSAAVYPVSQNSVALIASSNFSASGFAGATGASAAATATLTANTVAASSFTLDGILIEFNPGTDDTTATVAGFVYACINAHPVLSRRFRASWAPGTALVTIKAKFGILTFSAALALAHPAPLANPAAAPVLTAAAGGTLPAGVYSVGFSFANSRGQTLLSPAATVTLAANQKITVSAVTPPDLDATRKATVSWYCSPAKGSAKLRFHSNNNGAGFVIDALPLLSAPIPPDLNRTGAEILRVSAVFSDRSEPRSNAARSNVMKASYKWYLSGREKSINRVDVKFRDSTQDFRLVELRLRDDAHIKKVKKVSNLVINGQAIDNYHQAYRVASGILAEARDADFFYSWTADREALLLREGDVVAITDDGAQIYNLPVRIESVEFSTEDDFPKATFTARKYSTTLYDDSVAERTIPVIIEPSENLLYTAA